MGALITFFWDYDTQWGGDRSRAGQGPRNYGHLEFENTGRLLELLHEFDVAACFAVVGAAALPGKRPYHNPKQIREIHRAGHEIASHSYRHEWLPALNAAALRETLRCSKDALEQCIGASVDTFVPPFNQPFDCVERFAFSLSERREVKKDRTDLAKLCRALKETGYQLARVSYCSVKDQVLGRVLNKRSRGPSRVEKIAGFPCIRLNTRGGFDSTVANEIKAHLATNGIWVVYGHPHSAMECGPQSFACLRTLLEKVSRWRAQGLVRCIRPFELLKQQESEAARNARESTEVGAMGAP